MPRLVSQTPKYRKHRASGQAIVELSGRVHYLGPYGTRASRHEYDRLVMEWLARGRHPEVSLSTGGLTIVELCSRYSKYAASYYQKDGKPTSLHLVKHALKTLRKIYGRELATEFGPLARVIVKCCG